MSGIEPESARCPHDLRSRAIAGKASPAPLLAPSAWETSVVRYPRTNRAPSYLARSGPVWVHACRATRAPHSANSSSRDTARSDCVVVRNYVCSREVSSVPSAQTVLSFPRRNQSSPWFLILLFAARKMATEIRPLHAAPLDASREALQ